MSLPRPRSLLAFLFCSAALSTVACSAIDGGDTSSSDVTSGIAVKGEAPLFPGVNFDTGLQPAASPAQISLKATAGGSLRISADAHRAGDRVEGNKGSGKLAIDLHAKLEGRLKITSSFQSYDGDIPGLKDIDIAATSETPFDPFLLGDGEEAATTANVPETKLPDVPLSGVPGHLELTVKQGTTVTAKLHGSCLKGSESRAAFTGATTMSGKLVLQAKLVLDLPKPMNQSVDLPALTIDLPETKGAIDAKSDAAGIPDSFTAGACGASSGSGATGSSGAPESPKPTAPAECSDLAMSGSTVTIERGTGTMPKGAGGRIADGTYTLLSVRMFDDSPDIGTTMRRTYRLSQGKIDSVTDDGPDSKAVLRSSGVYVTDGSVLHRSFSCPANQLFPDDAPEYTATASSLTLIFTDTSTVVTYGKQ